MLDGPDRYARRIVTMFLYCYTESDDEALALAEQIAKEISERTDCALLATDQIEIIKSDDTHT